MRINIYKLLFRNSFSREGKKINNGIVNLEWYRDDLNLGDYLSVVVCNYMLSLHSLNLKSKRVSRKNRHLMAIGSILGGRGDFDATVWGSGIRNFSSIHVLGLKKFFQKLDVRAVRGPLTRDGLIQCGIECPNVFGDPAILMPEIYMPRKAEKKGNVLILHYLSKDEKIVNTEQNSFLDIQTVDYEYFIDKIVASEKVISSSLHGIILAESYGIPAVFLREGIEAETLKFYDWYYSTERYNVKMAMSLEEAITMEPMPLPNLDEMRKNLKEAFPYDLWEK